MIKGGWGRSTNRQFIVDVNGYRRWDRLRVYKWRDLNGNNDYDLGETDRDPNGDDFVETAGEASTPATHRRPEPQREAAQAG